MLYKRIKSVRLINKNLNQPKPISHPPTIRRFRKISLINMLRLSTIVDRENLHIRLIFWDSNFRSNKTGLNQFLRKFLIWQVSRYLKYINGDGIKERSKVLKESLIKVCTNFILSNQMMMILMSIILKL